MNTDERSITSFFWPGEPVKNVLAGGGELSMFGGQFDLTDPVAAGHSFGGATTLLALQQDPRWPFRRIRQYLP